MKVILCLVLSAVATTSTSANYGSSGTTICPSVCTDLYQPVCGSDGVTYSNECYLRLADCESQEQITLAYDGECVAEASSTSTDTSGSAGCTEICPFIFRPVCGSDGVTYANDCLLGIAQCKSGGAITQVSEGACPGSSYESSEAGSDGCPNVCIEIFRPVCGSDGVTYANSCFLGIASCHDPSITLAHNGACEGASLSSEGSYETGNPSIDSSASTNSSTSTDSSQETATDNSNTSSCPSICPAIYAPVCGSDGVTYANECKLEVASCNHPELSLTKASDGACTPVECKTY